MVVMAEAPFCGGAGTGEGGSRRHRHRLDRLRRRPDLRPRITRDRSARSAFSLPANTPAGHEPAIGPLMVTLHRNGASLTQCYARTDGEIQASGPRPAERLLIPIPATSAEPREERRCTSRGTCICGSSQCSICPSTTRTGERPAQGSAGRCSTNRGKNRFLPRRPQHPKPERPDQDQTYSRSPTPIDESGDGPRSPLIKDGDAIKLEIKYRWPLRHGFRGA